ncbi:phosphotransferase [Nocardioides sp.]|uniref:phosphotransferase n=1 Tax=Nocardioides sp. TaxID=35761 RepID=UPI003783C03C
MNVEDITAAWVADVLGTEVRDLEVERVGTGQIGTCYRLRLDGARTVLAKLPAEDPGARDLMAGVYRSEVRFYTQLAGTVAVRAPACHHAEMATDSGDFVLLLEDLAPLEPGDQLRGCTVEQARDAVENLAGLHGPRWSDPTLLQVEGLSVNGPEDAALLAELYGPATELFLDGLGDLVSAEDATTLRECVEVCEQWALGRSERFALMHGDYRLDNLMFPADGGPGVVAVDWQTLSLALPARDLAFFLGTSLPPVERRAHERELVAAYHHALTAYGVEGYSLEQAFDDYVFAMVQGPLVAVFGCAYGARTERGDRMFATMVARSCAAIRDLGTLGLVKES